MRRNVSLALSNYHFTQGNPRPTVPAIVDVGGLQIKDPPSPLPEHLQKWLDNAEHGVIYMSMGTNIQSSDLTPFKLIAILKSFANLKERVVWKFENETIPELPTNVMISKWLPQADLLAHRNIKLFITHGGLGGVVEARYHGVPLLGIPIFADQATNINKEIKKGVATVVSYRNLTHESFSNAINEVLNNPSYRENAKRISSLFRDRPEKPMETAVFWTEYVLRHHGAKHIQANSVYLNFWQFHSLDVIGFLLLIVLIICFINIYIFKRIWRQIFNKEVKLKND